MATIELRNGERVPPATVKRLTLAAVKLNAQVGDPTQAAR